MSAHHPAVFAIIPDADPVEKRNKFTESDGARVKLKVEINLGEAVPSIILLQS